MSIFSVILAKIKPAVVASEADVYNLFLRIRRGLPIFVHEVEAANQWIITNIPTVAARLNEVLASLTTLQATTGLTLPASALVAIADANKTVTALNAYATASAAGKTTVQSIAAGITAITQAGASHSALGIAIVSAPATAPASVPQP